MRDYELDPACEFEEVQVKYMYIQKNQNGELKFLTWPYLWKTPNQIKVLFKEGVVICSPYRICKEECNRGHSLIASKYIIFCKLMREWCLISVKIIGYIHKTTFLHGKYSSNLWISAEVSCPAFSKKTHKFGLSVL